MDDTQLGAPDATVARTVTGRFLDSDTHTAIEYLADDRPAPGLAIVFGPLNAPDLSVALPGQAALLAAGFDVLAVRPRSNNWYQDLSEEALAQIVAQLPAYDVRFAVGCDMGGYAALYFAGAVGATRVLALSPAVSPSAPVTPWEIRWTLLAPEMVTHRSMHEALADSDATIEIVHDPETLDQNHVAMIAPDIARGRVRPIHYGSSPIAAMLSDVDMLDPYIVAIATGAPPPGDRTIRAVRRRSTRYLTALATTAVRHNHRPLAERLFEMALEAGRAVETLLAYGQYLAQARRPAAALPYIDEAVKGMAPHAHWMAYRAHLEELTGDLPAAAESYALASQYEPNVVLFRDAEARVLRLMLSLNRDLAPQTKDEKAALATLDRLKRGGNASGLGVRALLGGIGLSFAIVLVFWIVGGIFEMR